MDKTEKKLLNFLRDNKVLPKLKEGYKYEVSENYYFEDMTFVEIISLKDLQPVEIVYLGVISALKKRLRHKRHMYEDYFVCTEKGKIIYEGE